MSRPSLYTTIFLVTLILLAVLSLNTSANSLSANTNSSASDDAVDVSFQFSPPIGEAIKSISVRGSFNGWGETPMEKRDDGSWSVTLSLAPGEIQYKYFINGEWPCDMALGSGGPFDPAADRYVSDGYGGQNAVRVVGGGVAAARHRDPAAIEAHMEAMKSRIGEASIEIYPVILGNQGMTRISELVAVFLERANLEDLRVNETPFNVSAVSDVWTNARAFGEFVAGASTEADYALLGEFWPRPDGGVEVRGIVVDSQGQPVWVDSHVIASDFNPMHGTQVLVQRLRTRLGLPDPEREDAPEGMWAEHWRQDSGMPTDAESAAMEERLEEFRARHASAELIVFPILQSGALNREGAAQLAELLTAEDLCQTKVAAVDLAPELESGRGQAARLWAMARKFRDHVRATGIDADYALFAEYALDAEAQRVFAVNFVVCDARGEWVMADVINDHHEDFQKLGPKTVGCCGRLVAQRVKGYLAMR